MVFALLATLAVCTSRRWALVEERAEDLTAGNSAETVRRWSLIVVGLLLWLVNRFIPMEGTIKSILNAVVVIATILWLLNIFGVFHSMSHYRVGT